MSFLLMTLDNIAVYITNYFLLPKQIKIDDDYTAVPTNREFSVTGLNDNVDEKFLRGLCR